MVCTRPAFGAALSPADSVTIIEHCQQIENWRDLQPFVMDVLEARMCLWRHGLRPLGGRDRFGEELDLGMLFRMADLSPEAAALRRTVTERPAASDDRILADLRRLRAARDRARARLDDAQGSLRKRLSARQEARLVLIGVLE